MAQAATLFDSKTNKFNLAAILNAAHHRAAAYVERAKANRLAGIHTRYAFVFKDALQRVWAEAQMQKCVAEHQAKPVVVLSQIDRLREERDGLKYKSGRVQIGARRRELDYQIAMLEAA